jgi:hypothetical protein
MSIKRTRQCIKHTFLALTLALASCLAPISATAAEIIRSSQPDGPDIVSISGVIQPSDDQRFIEVAGNPRDVTITLNSIGGLNQPAANIGSLIRSRGWETAVRNGAHCYSACALIWFAGVYRHLDRYARLGLHSASTESTGERHEEANRKIAIYLEAMGAPQEVIDLQSKADPCCINHIDYTQAEAWGLLNERPVTRFWEMTVSPPSAFPPPIRRGQDAAPPLITTAQTPSSAQVSSSVLQSLPTEVQKDIESVRAACRENLGHLGADASQTREVSATTAWPYSPSPARTPLWSTTWNFAAANASRVPTAPTGAATPSPSTSAPLD